MEGRLVGIAFIVILLGVITFIGAYYFQTYKETVLTTNSTDSSENVLANYNSPQTLSQIPTSLTVTRKNQTWLYFDAVDNGVSSDAVNLGSSAAGDPLRLENDNLTISMWVNHTGGDDEWQRLIGKAGDYTDFSGNDDYILSFGNDSEGFTDRVCILVGGNDTTYYEATCSTGNLSKNTWYHVVGTYETNVKDLSETTLMLQDADTEVMDDTKILNDTGFTNLEWGAHTSAEWFANSSSEAAVFIKFNTNDLPQGIDIISAQFNFYVNTNSLDAGESIEIYPQHVYAYSTFAVGGGEWAEGGGGVTGNACSGTEICWDNHPTGSEYNATNESSLVFDENDAVGWYNFSVKEAVTTSYNSSEKNFTLWVRATAVAGTMVYDKIIIDTKETATASQKPYLNITYKKQKYPQGNCSIYINGIFNNTKENCNLMRATTGVSIVLNDEYNNQGQYKGEIDEVRVYNRTLNASTILEIYNSGRNPNSNLNSTGLITWLPFNENSALIAYDLSDLSNNGTLVGPPSWYDDEINISLVENTDYNLSSNIFTIIKQNLSWHQINLLYAFSTDKVDEADYALAEDVEVGIGEFGNWFKIIVIAGIATVVLVLILLNFGRRPEEIGY